MDRNARIVLHQHRSSIGRRAKATQAVEFFNVLTSPALLDTVESVLPEHRERLYPPSVTSSMFMRQVLESDGSCQKAVNGWAAQRVADHPTQLSALAAVPLQDVDVAIAELDYARHTLHLAGVEIGCNINGCPVGASELEPFFAAAAALDMPVFVPSMRPANRERLVGPAALEVALGFPSEIGLATASAISGNLLLRHPTLRIAFSHGGGALAMLLPRLQHAWHTLPEVRENMPVAPARQRRRTHLLACCPAGTSVHCMLLPPLTLMTCPVMKDASSDARNATVATTSSIEARRPVGIRPIIFPKKSGYRRAFSASRGPPVSTPEGATVLTVIPCGANSRARPELMPCMPPLAAL